MISRTFLALVLPFWAALTQADELVDLTVSQVLAMQQDRAALVIDIRTEKEWDTTGTIPSSHKLEFFNNAGDYDAERWLAQLEKLKTTPEQPVILVCRSGNRSGIVGNYLTRQLGMRNIYHLSSGIDSWTAAGQKLVKTCVNQLACN